jgi:hypothetical protein
VTLHYAQGKKPPLHVAEKTKDTGPSKLRVNRSALRNSGQACATLDGTCYNRAQLAGVGRSGEYERIGIDFG